MKSFNDYLNDFNEIGLAETVSKDVVGVSGLPGLHPDELVLFETGQLGQTLFLGQEMAQILLLNEKPVKSGTKVARTNEKLSIPVGDELLGKLINPLGVSLNGSRPLPKDLPCRPIKNEPPPISQRSQIKKQLETGVSLVDTLLPLGYGQRELILGDRKTGKTNFLLQTMVNQARLGVVCIWAVIGKKTSEIKQIQEYFTKHQVMDKVIIVASGASEVPGLIYIAPASAITIAEYFKEKGRDSLVVLDDLFMHAKFYREIALLSKRFPGRESYPVDVFFNHAVLMERGGNFSINNQDVSVSLLPICETNEGDLSGYIQTNLMSMTDGHLFFDKELFSKGRRPPINPFLSVTRVGRQTQTSLGREISRDLMAFLVRYQKMTGFIHFGAELTQEAKSVLVKGKQFTDFFDQKAGEFIPAGIGAYIIASLWFGLWEGEEKLEEKISRTVDEYRENKKFRILIDEMVKKSGSLKELGEEIKTV